MRTQLLFEGKDVGVIENGPLQIGQTVRAGSEVYEVLQVGGDVAIVDRVPPVPKPAHPPRNVH